MPRGITKRRPITITALLDAAMELFAEQGYGATSIPDICARAGLTKGAFYSNFANKDALFLALLDRSWERRAEWIRRAMPAGDELAAALDNRTPHSRSRGGPAMDARLDGVLPARHPPAGRGPAPRRARAADPGGTSRFW